MGAGVGKRSGLGRVALKGTVWLLAIVLLLLVALRILAAAREGDDRAPNGIVRFPTSHGRVAAQVSGPVAGPVVVIVHGTAAWSGFWKDVSAHLASHGWRVVAVDLPPFGWSDRDPSGHYDRAIQAERLDGVITAAAGDRRAIVLGHSFGAGPVTELALRHPGRLRGLVLVDAALGELDASDEGGAAKFLRFPPAAELTTSAALTNPAALGPLLRSMLARKEQGERWLPVLREPMRRSGTTSAYAAWLPNLFSKTDGSLSRRSANLRAIKVPVALIWGGADRVTPLEQGKRLAGLTRARSLTVLSGVGHIPHIEDPDGFRAALDKALAGINGERE